MPNTSLKLQKNFSDDAEDKSHLFCKILLKWFNRNARIFSWRKENDAFKILIAEVMLQRTKAEQVEPVYSEFIQEFKDLRSIGTEDRYRIREYFKKLGLLWRSDSVISMAEYISKECNGIIPGSKTDLMQIPGIGDYIADAVLVFAFNRKITVIDSNVIRLVSRFFGFKGGKGEVRRNKTFREFCQKLVDNIDPSDIKNFNWALIDFSYFTCKTIPICFKCPISMKCSYFKVMFNNIEK